MYVCTYNTSAVCLHFFSRKKYLRVSTQDMRVFAIFTRHTFLRKRVFGKGGEGRASLGADDVFLGGKGEEEGEEREKGVTKRRRKEAGMLGSDKGSYVVQKAEYWG